MKQRYKKHPGAFTSDTQQRIDLAILTTKVEAMKAANAKYKAAGAGQAYSEQDFMDVANEIHDLIYDPPTEKETDENTGL